MQEAFSEEVLFARTILYRFLALAFHEPHAPLMDFLARAEEQQALQAAAAEIDAQYETQAVGQAVGEILAVRPSTGEAEQDLRVEYTRLFLGPGKVPCQPYESLYDESRPAEDRNTVQGPSAFDMEELLEAEGLEINLGYKDLADHIAIELEYIYYLLHKAVESEAGIDPAYMDRSDQFLAKHLAHWLPAYGEGVARNARHPFYQHLGSLLAAFMRLEAEQVGQAAAA